MTLNDLKVEIFPDINDAPVAATAQQAGNGADLIDRFNSLNDQTIFIQNRGNTNLNQINIIATKANENEDKLEAIENSGIINLNKPDTLWGDYQELYVDADNGDDNNDGSEDFPLKTIKAATDILKTKIVDQNFALYLMGTFNEPIDLSEIYGLTSGEAYHQGQYIEFYGDGGNPVTINVDEEFILFNPDPKQRLNIYISEVSFNSSTNSLKIKNQSGLLNLENCSFNKTTTNESYVLEVYHADKVEIYGSEPTHRFYANGETSENGLYIENAFVSADGMTFESLSTAVTVGRNGKFNNTSEQNTFTNISNKYNLTNLGILKTDYIEDLTNNSNPLNYNPSDYREGILLNKLSDRIFYLDSNDSNTTKTLIGKSSKNEQLFYFSLNQIDAGTVIKIKINNATVATLNDTTLELKINSNLPYIFSSQALEVEIVGTVSDDTVLTILGFDY